ncbi:insulinase family protein [Neptuniibacter sp. QD37_6]|uniref:insulinase family protein n=1 Tax=Neptuniibacter sp. QD37_6 TaxID=3398210 RepID=UPI0039F52A52
MLTLSMPRLVVFAGLLSAVLSTSVFADVEKSPNDPNVYRSLTLDNQLRVLLISNPKSDKAAASMNVAVGSSANPKDRAGLAHYLEHMLFLGTEKYPAADEYQSFIRSHGGGHNAYTSMENTNYFFDVTADNLEPALDRFAQFFIAPLFDEKYVDRERHAVHSEYQSKIKDDYRRSYAVTKSLMNQQNSHNWFAVGSLETLANTPERPIRKELIEFYQRYYSANLMALAVQGREPLDQLEQMVREKFSAVKNYDSKALETKTSLFNPKQLPQLVKIKSVKDIRSLTLTFPTAETRSHWESKPLYYISNLIGYEGKGSLLSLLKEKGLATSLSASQGHDLNNQASFMVSMRLTEQGLEQYQQVIQMVFQYVELLKQSGIQKALFDEEKQLSNIRFTFQEQSEPIHMVSGLTRQMQFFPTEKVISANYIFNEFKPELIKQYLDQIKPENMLVTIKARDVKGNQTEPDYNVPFEVSQFNAETLKSFAVKAIDPKLTVRSTNPFIAQDLDLLAAETKQAPYLLQDKQGFEHWHLTDVSFNVPKANAYFTLQTPFANTSAKNWVMNSLFTEMLQEQLNETLYDAYLAGLGTNIYPHMKGFTVRLSGYNDKLDLLTKDVVSAINKPDLPKERFEILKQKYLDNLANQLNDKPYNQTTSRLYELLLPQWSNAEERLEAEKLTVRDLAAYAVKLQETPDIKLLTHGNISEVDAETIASLIKDNLWQSGAKEVAPVQVVQVPRQQQLTDKLVIDHDDSAISVLLQGNNNSNKEKAEFSVLSEILSAPFYNQLRTEKQLGYIVFGTPLQMHKTPGIAFIVQSPVADGKTLVKEIDQFLMQSSNLISQLNQEELNKFKRSVISRITKQDKKLSSRTKRFWRELDWSETEFDTRKKLAEAVEKVTLDDLSKRYAGLFDRRLTVLSTGKKFERPATEPTQLTRLFKQRRDQGAFTPDN